MYGPGMTDWIRRDSREKIRKEKIRKEKARKEKARNTSGFAYKKGHKYPTVPKVVFKKRLLYQKMRQLDPSTWVISPEERQKRYDAMTANINRQFRQQLPQIMEGYNAMFGAGGGGAVSGEKFNPMGQLGTFTRGYQETLANMALQNELAAEQEQQQRMWAALTGGQAAVDSARRQEAALAQAAAMQPSGGDPWAQVIGSAVGSAAAAIPFIW